MEIFKENVCFCSILAVHTVYTLYSSQAHVYEIGAWSHLVARTWSALMEHSALLVSLDRDFVRYGRTRRNNERKSGHSICTRRVEVVWVRPMMALKVQIPIDCYFLVFVVCILDQ